MLYLAIDQHRKQLTVNLRDEDAQVLVQRQVSTRWQAVREFLQDIQERGRQAGGWLVIGHSESLLNVTDRFQLVGRTVYRRIK